MRKEGEIKSRSRYPSGSTKKSDRVAAMEMEKRDSEQRKKVLETIAGKPYNDITKDAISGIVSKFCKRLYMFGEKYPQFVRDIVGGLIQHPNICATDREASVSHPNSPRRC